MKTITLLIFWFLLITNSAFSTVPSVYISYKNGRIDTLNFSNENVFNIVMDTIAVSISDDANNRTNDTPNDLKVFPNPTESTINISLNSQTQTFAEVNIYNSDGIKVKEINNFFLLTGINTLPWDLKDNYGSKVTSGVYFVEIKYSDKVITVKIVLTR